MSSESLRLRKFQDFEITGAGGLSPRPLLVLHGADDDTVPALDARAVADAHGSAELKIVGGAGHQLRHDPRAVALLLGWLDRHRVEAQAPVGG